VGLIGSYFDYDTLYFTFSQQIWRILGNLRFAWEERRFQGDLNPDNMVNNNGGNPDMGASRTDDLLTFHLDLNYPIRNWLVVSLGDDVQINLSNCAFRLNGNPTAIPCDYKRNDVWLKIAVAY